MSRPEVHIATTAEAENIGRLLHEFNTEFGEPTPGPVALAARLTRLMQGGDTDVLIGSLGDGPAGLAVLRFREAIWAEALECYLAELYVVPARRGEGLGRRLLLAAMDAARARGATHVDLNTAETDEAARALYESLGFSSSEGRPDGPINIYYEREL